MPLRVYVVRLIGEVGGINCLVGERRGHGRRDKLIGVSVGRVMSMSSLLMVGQQNLIDALLNYRVDVRHGYGGCFLRY